MLYKITVYYGEKEQQKQSNCFSYNYKKKKKSGAMISSYSNYFFKYSRKKCISTST